MVCTTSLNPFEGLLAESSRPYFVLEVLRHVGGKLAVQGDDDPRVQVLTGRL